MAKTHSGGLEFTWTNKDKALLSTGDGKYDSTFVDRSDHCVSEVRLLHAVDRVEAPSGRPEGSNLPAPTTDNLLITGDAMHTLDALTKILEYADKYLGKVKLVYCQARVSWRVSYLALRGSGGSSYGAVGSEWASRNAAGVSPPKALWGRKVLRAAYRPSHVACADKVTP